MSNIPSSLKRVLESNPKLEYYIKGLPSLGENRINKEFSSDVLKIYSAFELYGNELYELENDKIKELHSKSLGGGSPMKTGAFPLCNEAIID